MNILFGRGGFKGSHFFGELNLMFNNIPNPYLGVIKKYLFRVASYEMRLGFNQNTTVFWLKPQEKKILSLELKKIQAAIFSDKSKEKFSQGGEFLQLYEFERNVKSEEIFFFTFYSDKEEVPFYNGYEIEFDYSSPIEGGVEGEEISLRFLKPELAQEIKEKSLKIIDKEGSPLYIYDVKKGKVLGTKKLFLENSNLSGWKGDSSIRSERGWELSRTVVEPSGKATSSRLKLKELAILQNKKINTETYGFWENLWSTLDAKGIKSSLDYIPYE